MPRPSMLPPATPDLTDRSYWTGTIKMSLSKLFILRALFQAPAHGYEIARRVAEMTRGCCSPTEGTIYPVLRDFEAGGYVTRADVVVGGRERKVYTLTDKGRDALRTALIAWAEASQALESASRDLFPDGISEPSAAAECCSTSRSDPAGADHQ